MKAFHPPFQILVAPPMVLAEHTRPDIAKNITGIVGSIETGTSQNAVCSNCVSRFLPSSMPTQAAMIGVESGEYILAFFCQFCSDAHSAQALVETALSAYQQHGSVSAEDAAARLQVQ